MRLAMWHIPVRNRRNDLLGDMTTVPDADDSLSATAQCEVSREFGVRHDVVVRDDRLDQRHIFALAGHEPPLSR